MRLSLLGTLLLHAVFGQDPKAAFDRGDYAAAIELFEAAQKKKAECANFLYIGLARYRLEQAGEALASFRAAAQCDPKLVTAQLAMGEAYDAHGNEGEALTAYLQALELEPRSALALRAAANLYLKSAQHRDALPLLERLVEVAPGAADAHADLGAVYAASGNQDDAAVQFRRALEIQGEYYPALTGLGNLLARAGESETAMALLRKAVAVRPKAYEAHFLLGSALNRQGAFAEARVELEQAARLGGGKEPQVFYQLARAWGGLGKAEERKAALTEFSALTRKEKDDGERQRQAARLTDEARGLLQTGDLEGAAVRLEQAREARPGDATLLFRLAALHFDLGRLETAREYAQASISLSSTTWLSHYLLGLVEKSARRWVDARASLEMAAGVNGREAPVFNALGEVALEQGNIPAAIGYFEKACELAPGDAVYRGNLEAARKR